MGLQLEHWQRLQRKALGLAPSTTGRLEPSVTPDPGYAELASDLCRSLTHGMTMHPPTHTTFLNKEKILLLESRWPRIMKLIFGRLVYGL